jgi:hypothetical protein
MNHPQPQRLLLDAVQSRKLLDPQLKLCVLSQQLIARPRLGSQIVLDLDDPGELQQEQDGKHADAQEGQEWKGPQAAS